MTDIEFHLLATDEEKQQWLHCCSLAQDHFRQGKAVHIAVNDEHHAAKLSEALWTFCETSFLPNSAINTQSDAPISIGWGEMEPKHEHTLINLTSSVPVYMAKFTLLIEVVPNNDGLKAKSRERYTHYRDRGYPLQHKNI